MRPNKTYPETNEKLAKDNLAQGQYGTSIIGTYVDSQVDSLQAALADAFNRIKILEMELLDLYRKLNNRD